MGLRLSGFLHSKSLFSLLDNLSVTFRPNAYKYFSAYVYKVKCAHKKKKEYMHRHTQNHVCRLVRLKTQQVQPSDKYLVLDRQAQSCQPGLIHSLIPFITMKINPFCPPLSFPLPSPPFHPLFSRPSSGSPFYIWSAFHFLPSPSKHTLPPGC